MKNRFLHFTFTKIFIGLIVCFGVAVLLQMGMSRLLKIYGLPPDVYHLLTGIVVAALTVVAYIVLFRKYERRTISELSTHRLGKHLLLGIAIGAGLQALTILVIYLKEDIQ